MILANFKLLKMKACGTFKILKKNINYENYSLIPQKW